MSAEHFLDGRVTLHGGDSRDVLRTLADSSIDAVVCDPPYALMTSGSAGFMGKDWDTGETAFAVEFWAEVMRVLKPGGHVVAFGGTRSFHRLVCAIEDAGFEIRDQLAWLYGTGFPKSHDVSKGIDRTNGETGRELEFCRFMRSSKLTRGHATDVLRAMGLISRNGTMVGHFYAVSNGGQPAVATPEIFEALRPYFGIDVPSRIEEIVARVAAEREVIGQKTSGISNKDEVQRHTIGASSSVLVDITKPATPEAARWSGWGTALKPALEPICLARKPLDGTVAANVLRWGTGAINIGACRVENADYDPAKVQRSQTAQDGHTVSLNIPGHEQPTYNAAGRWPANLVHDGSDEVVGAFPDSNGQQGRSTDAQRSRANVYGEPSDAGKTYEPRNDAGSAARFFYSAKADGDDRLASKHPTVKPVDLMRWLVRLVTPPGGVVLDPFAGTGTTGEAAWREGFNAVLIEREPDYQHDIARRMALAASSTRERRQERAKSRPALDLGPLFTSFPEAAE